MKIYNVTDYQFSEFGRVLSGFKLEEMEQYKKEIPVTDDVVYVPNVDEVCQLPIAKKFQNEVYGELPIQIGYCCGKNHLLNAVEYHKNSEINITMTDAILLLGRQQDIQMNHNYDTSLMKAFLIPKGCVVELYATTLHYAPCSVGGKEFFVYVILPKGTNEPLEEVDAKHENRLLVAKNKWLIAHREAKFDSKVHIGLVGENLSVE